MSTPNVCCIHPPIELATLPNASVCLFVCLFVFPALSYQSGSMARGLLVACLVAALSVSTASGFVFKAGGTGEWRVPAASSANASAYNQWAQRNRFRVGDAIGEDCCCSVTFLVSLSVHQCTAIIQYIE